MSPQESMKPSEANKTVYGTELDSLTTSSSTPTGSMPGQKQHAAADRLHQAAESIRSGSLTQKEQEARLRQKLADGIDTAGGYIRQIDVHGTSERVTSAVRANPMTAVVIGFAVGALVGRLLGNSRS